VFQSYVPTRGTCFAFHASQWMSHMNFFLLQVSFSPRLSLSPCARWEVRAKLIHLFVVETPRASATGYRSLHEKFRAGVTSLLKVKCVSHYPPSLFASTELPSLRGRRCACNKLVQGYRWKNKH